MRRGRIADFDASEPADGRLTRCRDWNGVVGAGGGRVASDGSRPVRGGEGGAASKQAVSIVAEYYAREARSLSDGSLLPLLSRRDPTSILDELHERVESLILDHGIRRFSLQSQRFRLANDILPIRNPRAGKEHEPRPPIPQRRPQIELLCTRDKSIKVLPVDRFNHVGVRKVYGGLAVNFGALGEDERGVFVSFLDPASATAHDLDEYGLRSTVVPDAMNLVRESEVDGCDLAVVDVAQDIRERLVGSKINLVEGADKRGSVNLHLCIEEREELTRYDWQASLIGSRARDAAR